MYTRTHLLTMALATMVILIMHFLTPYLEGIFSPLSMVLFWAYMVKVGAWATLAGCALWAFGIILTDNKEV